MALPEEFLTRLEQYAELADQERKIFVRLFGKDMSRQQIAQELSICDSNVSSSLTGVYRKFNKSGRGAENRLRTYLTQRYLNWKGASSSSSQTAIAPSNIDNLVQEVRDRIRPFIEQACGTMRVLDMSYPIGLNDIYTDVNILERITSRRSLELRELMLTAGYEQVDRICLGDVREKRVPALEAVERFSKLMILGKPGTGKTTFLKRLAMQCIGGKFKADCVPVFVTLKEFAEEEQKPSLFEYLNEWVGESFQAVVQAGRALFLLDGLDEVREVDGDRVLRQIKTLSQSVAQNIFVITCRIAAEEYTFEQFTEVEVAEFDDKQVAKFTNNWFHSRNDAVKAKRFLEKLKEDKPIREMAASPLLLTLLCLVFEDSGSFPINRAELYQNGVEVLLKKWDVKRNIERDLVYKGLSLKRKETLLRQIAYKTFEAGNYFFKQREVERYISEYIQNLPGASSDLEALEVDGAAVLESIEAHHGLLIKRARGIYSFSHLTFHEYFTASSIVATCDPYSLDDAKLRSLAARVTEARWREVFLLVVDLLEDSSSLIYLMKQQIDNLVKDDNIQSFLTRIPNKFLLEEELKNTIEFQGIDSVEVKFWLPKVRALWLGYNIQYIHNITLAIHVAASTKDTTFFDALQFSQLYTFRHYGYVLSLVMEPILNESSIDLLESFASSSLAMELEKNLKPFKEPLEVASHVSKERPFESQMNWWSVYGQLCINKVKELVDEHRATLQDQELGSQERLTLRKYYDANLLLINCMNRACYINKEVQQEIEETLFLPMADIEAWKKNNGKCD